MKRNKGFTLAEVLITLVVIGIIAAITVPIIMQNNKKKTYVTKMKKFYSSLSQAIKLAEAEQGLSSLDWDFSTGKYGGDKAGVEFYNKYLLKYMPVEYDWEGTLHGLLSDGVYIGGTLSNNQYMEINAHLAGTKWKYNYSDNFRICIYSRDYINKYNNVKPLDTCYANTKLSREKLISECNRYWDYCPALIIQDGWEIKDDFPRKL